MLWARVMRGTSSIENSVTPARPVAAPACGVPRGSHKADHDLAARQRRQVGMPAWGLAPSGRTCTDKSAAKTSSRGDDFGPFVCVRRRESRPPARPRFDHGLPSPP